VLRFHSFRIAHKKQTRDERHEFLPQLVQLAHDDLGRLNDDHSRDNGVRGGNGVDDVARDALGCEQALQNEQWSGQSETGNSEVETSKKSEVRHIEQLSAQTSKATQAACSNRPTALLHLQAVLG
jgi:hypothetical protein